METATQPTTETVSAYWESRGKTVADKRVGRTFRRSNGVLACNECCFKDRECDTPGHFHRNSCPFCLGTGINAAPQERPAQQGQHSALPWTQNGTHIMSGKILVTQISGSNRQFLLPEFENEANAALIVKCVNRSPAFQKLIGAAELLINEIGGYQNAIQLEGFTKLREALRLARKETE